MKKIIILLMLCVGLQTFAGQTESRPTLKGQDGGGGGVIKRDGMYLTFGSAKIKLDLSLAEEEIPSLGLLVQVLDAISMHPVENLTGGLLSALFPSQNRRYYKITQSQLSQKTHEKLIETYSKLVGNQVDPADLNLAAITVAGDTFLLPPFYQLKSSEQAAILFHESIWVIDPNAKYESLIKAEMEIQKHIEEYNTQPIYNLDLWLALGNLLPYKSPILASALQMDIERGLFTKYFPYEAQEPKDVFSILLPQSHDRSEYFDKASLIVELREAMVKYPEFQFLKVLYAYRDYVGDIYLKELNSRNFLNVEIRSSTRYDDCIGFRTPISKHVSSSKYPGVDFAGNAGACFSGGTR